MEEGNENQDNIENGNNIDNANNKNEIQNQENIDNNNNDNENNQDNNENQEQNENNNENENQNQEQVDNNNEDVNQNEIHVENNNENVDQNVNQNNNENVIQNGNPNNVPNQQINNNVGQGVVQNPPQPVQQNNNNNNINEENERTVGLIKSKIKEIKDKYNFSIQFYDLMNKILKLLQDLTYEKITNSVNECHSYFSFFKHSSELYSKFAEQINVSNNTIMSTVKVPKMNDDFLLGVMQKTQTLLFQNLLKISDGLKQNIISKGPLSKLQEKVNKIENIKKTNSNKLKEIEEIKKKLQKKYHKYEKVFESYVPSPNNLNNSRNRNIRPTLIDTPDFVYVTKNLLELMNKLTLDINLYIVDTKDSFYKVNELFVEMNNLLRDSVLIYIRESKKIFNIDVTKNFEEIENYYKKMEESKSDKIFSLDRIFNTSQSQQSIDTLLQQYYVLLNSSGRVKNELLTDRNKFSVKEYSNILLFFEWLISVSPQPTDLVTDDLIIKKITVKRDPGLFKGWKDSIFIFTKQQHLLIYDAPLSSENFVKIFELDKTSYRKKNDNKRRYLFEIIANRKGKIMDFKGNFLFDGLNEQNINDIPPLVYSAYNH